MCEDKKQKQKERAADLKIRAWGFFMGGLATLLAGLIAKSYGPAAGGLFLAFPATFPVSAWGVDLRERIKNKSGAQDCPEAKEENIKEVTGALFGSLSMCAFAVVALDLNSTTFFGSLLAAVFVWGLVAVILFNVWKPFAPAKMIEKEASAA